MAWRRGKKVTGEAFVSSSTLKTPEGKAAGVRAEVRVAKQPRTVTSTCGWRRDRICRRSLRSVFELWCGFGIGVRSACVVVAAAETMLSPRFAGRGSMSFLIAMLLTQVPGSWGEPAGAAFLIPVHDRFLSGLNAVSFDDLPR